MDPVVSRVDLRIFYLFIYLVEMPCMVYVSNRRLQKVAEVRPEELKSTCTESEDAANCYWLVTNCKACPSCKSPIQKNEGCNHMKCSKCKFDFCWVCLDSWKKHSSATVGKVIQT